MNVSIVTNILAPYTHQVYEAVAAAPIRLTVVTCASTEPGRHWHLDRSVAYRHIVLPGAHWHLGHNRNIHFNPAIVRTLRQLSPDAVFLAGFFPTILVAFGWARLRRLGIGVIMDNWGVQDLGTRSIVHRTLRRTVIGAAHAGIGASVKSVDLLASYGLASDRLFECPLIPGWAPPAHPEPFERRSFDILWCGTLNDEKGSRFFASVVERLSAERPLNVRVVGDGVDRCWLLDRLQRTAANVQYDGYLQQHELAAAYSSARVFLFPTRGDPWGLVANEAAQCGTPVVLSPHAGAAGELIEDGRAGFVVPLDVDAWCDRVRRLLGDAPLWRRMAAEARRVAVTRTVAESARSMRAAFERAACPRS